MARVFIIGSADGLEPLAAQTLLAEGHEIVVQTRNSTRLEAVHDLVDSGAAPQAEPITPVLPMGSLQNLHRTLVVDGEPIAVGVQPIGDALCHTNPTFAYGASLSINHAFTLAEIAGGTDDPRAIALEFEAASGHDAATRFDAVSAEDRDRLRLWQGEPIDVRDPGDSMALFLRMTAYPAAAKDPALFRAVARRVNLLDPPDALEQDDVLVARAQELAREGGIAASAGPTRDEVLEAIAKTSATGARRA